MKKGILALSVMLGLSLSACNDRGGHHERSGPGNRVDHECRQYSSCDRCTPVAGCGWCTTGVGEGLCAADPNECAGAAAFSWTWDPSGCFGAPADAGVAQPEDAAATTAIP
jgi:hypothetical protein